MPSRLIGAFRHTINQELRPNLADFIQYLAGDTEGLLTLVYVALKNSVSPEFVVKAFSQAGTDLDGELSKG